MVKSIWSSINPKVENFLVLILCFIAIIISGIAPEMSLIGIILFPIPIAIMYLKVEKIKFIQIIGTMILVSFIVNGFWGTIGAMACTIAVGAFIGDLLYTKKDGISIVKKMTLIIAGAILVAGMSYLVSNKVTVKQVVTTMEQSYSKRMDDIISKYKEIGISDTYVSTLNKYKSNFTSIRILSEVPYIVAVLSFIFAIIIYFLMRMILSESTVPRHSKVSFQNFYLSNLYGAALIGVFCIGIILKSKKVEYGAILSNGAMNILLYSLMLNGYAMVVYLLKKKYNMKKVPIIVVLIIGSIIFSNLVIAIIGFVELIVDFRKLDPYTLIKRKKEQ